MAKTKGLNTKRALIDKANTNVVVVTSVAAFIVAFSLVATKTLVSQARYQNRLISTERTAVKSLKTDINAATTLKNSYDAFTSTAQNVLGGDPGGTGPKDGDNAKIVLDALPSSYDFPALTNSLEAIMNDAGVTINSISGTDDEVAQSSNQSSVAPQPVPMQFQVSATGDYGSIQNLVSEFEHSIRPFQIQQLQLTAGDKSQLSINISAQTFYQPAKKLTVVTKVVQ